jgi:Peptidase propeptide and YPEB domain
MTSFLNSTRMAALMVATGLTLFSAGSALAEGDAPDAALQETLTAQMLAEGYEVRKMQIEEGMIEVYAIKDGATFEMYYGEDLALIKSCTDGVCTDATGAEVAGEDGDEG